jgi:hypothetical protein
MLRGGLSGPPDWNVGAGAANRGKTVEQAAVGEATRGSALMSGAAEQDETQWLAFPTPSWSWFGDASADDISLCAACSCDMFVAWLCEAGSCSHATIAAETPRRGSSNASRTRT